MLKSPLQMLLMMAKTKWHIITLFLGPFFTKSLFKHFVCASLCLFYLFLCVKSIFPLTFLSGQIIDKDKRGKKNGRKCVVAVSSVLSTMFVFCICFVFCFLQLPVLLSCSEGALCVNQSQLSGKLADHAHAQHIIIAITRYTQIRGRGGK